MMDALDTFLDLDASAARAELRRIGKDLERLVAQRRADFRRLWRCPVWNDTTDR